MKFAQQMLLVCLAGVVLGCGQKGPLVMPDAQKHKRAIPAIPGAPGKATPSGAAQSPAPQGAGSATSPAPPAPSTTPGTTPSTPPSSTPPPSSPQR